MIVNWFYHIDEVCSFSRTFKIFFLKIIAHTFFKNTNSKFMTYMYTHCLSITWVSWDKVYIWDKSSVDFPDHLNQRPHIISKSTTTLVLTPYEADMLTKVCMYTCRCIFINIVVLSKNMSHCHYVVILQYICFCACICLHTYSKYSG